MKMVRHRILKGDYRLLPRGILRSIVRDSGHREVFVVQRYIEFPKWLARIVRKEGYWKHVDYHFMYRLAEQEMVRDQRKRMRKPVKPVLMKEEGRVIE